MRKEHPHNKINTIDKMNKSRNDFLQGHQTRMIMKMNVVDINSRIEYIQEQGYKAQIIF